MGLVVAHVMAPILTLLSSRHHLVFEAGMCSVQIRHLQSRGSTFGSRKCGAGSTDVRPWASIPAFSTYNNYPTQPTSSLDLQLLIISKLGFSLGDHHITIQNVNATFLGNPGGIIQLLLFAIPCLPDCSVRAVRGQDHS